MPRDSNPYRRDVIKGSLAAGITGIGGYSVVGGAAGSQGGDFMEQASSIDFAGNWQDRRLASLDEWPLEQRQQIPDEDNHGDSQAWAESEAVQSAPWQPPEGWDDTAAADVDSLQIMNFGGMQFDPGTAAAHGMFEDRTGIDLNPLEIVVDQAIPRQTAFLQAGEAEPTMFQIVMTDSFSSFVQADYLQAIDPLFADDSMWDPLQPIARLSEADGTLYGGPAYLEGSLVHVHVDMLEEQGVDEDVIDSITEGEWSWDELETVMEAFEGTDAYGWAYRGASRTYTLRDWKKLFYQAGGQFVNDDDTVTVNTDAGYLALEKMVEWLDNGWVPDAVVNYGQGDLADGFMSKQFAMVPVFGDLVPPAVAEFGDTYQPTLSPEGSADAPNPTRAGIASLQSVGVNVNAPVEKKLAALVYMDARITEPVAWQEFVYEGNQSLYQTIYDQAAETGAADYAEIRGEQASLNLAETFPQQRAINQNVSSEIQQAIAGAKSPEEALDTAQDFIDTVLAQ